MIPLVLVMANHQFGHKVCGIVEVNVVKTRDQSNAGARVIRALRSRDTEAASAGEQRSIISCRAIAVRQGSALARRSRTSSCARHSSNDILDSLTSGLCEPRKVLQARRSLYMHNIVCASEDYMHSICEVTAQVQIRHKSFAKRAPPLERLSASHSLITSTS